MISWRQKEPWSSSWLHLLHDWQISVSVWNCESVSAALREEWHQLHVLLGGWDLHHHECSQRASPLEILRLPCWNLQNLVQQRLPGAGLNLLLPQESQYKFLYLVTFHMFVSPISCDLCASTLMLLLTWHASCVPCCTYSSWLAMHLSPGGRC